MWDGRRYACNQYMLVSGMLVPRVICTYLFVNQARYLSFLSILPSTTVPYNSIHSDFHCNSMITSRVCIMVTGFENRAQEPLFSTSMTCI